MKRKIHFRREKLYIGKHKQYSTILRKATMALRFGRFKENYIGIYAVLFVMNVLDEKLFFGRERKFEESVTFISSL